MRVIRCRNRGPNGTRTCDLTRDRDLPRLASHGSQPSPAPPERGTTLGRVARLLHAAAEAIAAQPPRAARRARRHHRPGPGALVAARRRPLLAHSSDTALLYAETIRFGQDQGGVRDDIDRFAPANCSSTATWEPSTGGPSRQPRTRGQSEPEASRPCARRCWPR